MKGYQDLFVMALKAENVARQAYQADAYSVAESKHFAEAAMSRVLAAADEITELAAQIRDARGEQTAEDAFAIVLSGKVGRISKPGQWIVYRDGGKVICEVQTDEA